MPFCNEKLESFPVTCELNPRKGGINHLIFIRCEDEELIPPYESTLLDWESFVSTYCVFITPKIKGDKPETTANKARTSVCRPERVVGMQKTINFTDYNSYDDYSDYKFWDYMFRYDKKYLFGYITCDEVIYGFYSFELEVDTVTPEDSKNYEYKTGIINWNGMRLTSGYKIPGISSLLTENSCI